MAGARRRAERDVSPAATATRELGENLGIVRELRGLLGIDYVPADASRAEELNVVFDGGTLYDPVEFRLPHHKFSDTRFVEPDRLGEYLPELPSRRIWVALRARVDGHPAYVEDGRVHPVSPRNLDIGRWDPQDGVTYEVAEAVLGEMIVHCSSRLYKLETAGDADVVARQLWLDLIGLYARRRRELTLRNMPALRAVIDLYGPVLRRIDRQPDA